MKAAGDDTDHKTSERPGTTTGNTHHESDGSHPSSSANRDLSEEEQVSEILASASFSEEQMDVIVGAMTEGVPARILLGIMKETYSPDTMRKVLAYLKRVRGE